MIKVINYKECKSLDDILLRSQFSYDDINEKVKAILADVKQNGDDALKKYAKMFDNAEIDNLEVTEKEIEEAYSRVDEKFKETLKLAYNNIEKFHKKQLRNSYITNEEDGIVMGQIINPIEKVGVYIPGGTAVYPSTVLMNVIPAKVAGVNEIILVSPPNKEGKINDNILAAAKIAGVNRVFKTGGAQAIAALSYGTESIPKVYKIVGPGNIYVAMAKRLVYGEVSIDMVAGPSEVLIIADETANHIHIASDMLAQAEHDKLASSILVTTSKEIAEKTKEELYKQLEKLSRKDIAMESIENNGRIIITETIDEAIYINNEIAPEHLEISIKEPFSVLSKIKNAGSIFLGDYTPEALGDYLSGANHVIPTSGTAKFASPLSVDDFIKKSYITYYTKDALSKVKDNIINFAEHESLEAHANSVKVRF
ncbi:histidinol dehydrogenase [Brachyspira hyodysenteriae]|uniref:histidinol dehydrogenase n=1 Tax=Brachyspira hyodysenteriae TaxID=159 RepID=UPI001ADDD80E|nr:histidinol dehydrogenase [Brachyspira hyodysenteriae]MBT8719815.1 histidinol dehydrogenase [Brachyspira hyodysenteriae]MBT8730054.1 histidinol dehydrogenase [Brachyspira hyodysenteriae]MBT8732223.1 histidinol dehydrogenase [Brachyspira hyodysenteriae]MBT8734423.1 histidinol dehydrogenase [Brachyspira hyodysenteriae]MBT8737416.1 histidinol dehydrogenase [Brachyspira hyodysenteriae]